MTTTQHKFRFPLATETQLREYLWYAFGVAIPDQQVCPYHTSPWHIFCDAYFNRHRVQVVKASRGVAGKTFLFAHLGLLQAITQQAQVTLLGGSAQQSKLLHDYMVKAWQSPGAPQHCLRSDPTQMETRLSNGATIRALTAASTSVRGPHPHKLVIDEADECDLEVLTAALSQPMSRDGIPAGIVISSTHHYPDGTFSEILKLASEKHWVVREYCYQETLEPHGWLSAAELDAKRSDVPAHVWQIEYDLQQPSFEGRAIMPDAVHRMFDARLGTYEGREGEYIEVEAPQPNGIYISTADWAKSIDWTVIMTLRTDCVPAKLVAFERLGRRPWPLMIARFEQRLQRYPGKARHDGTGLGNVIDDHLTQPAEAVILVGKVRSNLFSNYVNAVEKGALVAPLIRWMRDEHLYCVVDDLYGRGHPPDSLVAAALGAEGLVTPVHAAVWLDDDPDLERQAREYAETAEADDEPQVISLWDPRRRLTSRW
jgi:hypothetical protein